MDLFEYQAKDLFAKHGVPVLRRHRRRHAEEARAAAEELGRPVVVVVKAQVKAGGRGKAGGVKLAKTPDEAEQRAPRRSSGMDIKGHTVTPGADRRRPPTSPRSTTSRSCSTAPTARYLAHRLASRAAWRSRSSPRATRRAGEDPDRPADAASTQAKAGEIVAAGGFPADVRRPGRRGASQTLWDGLRRGGRHARRGQPAGQTADGRRSSRSTARSRSTTTPTSATPTTRRSRTRTRPTRSRRKAKEKGLNYVKLDGQVGIIGNGAGLVMSHPRRRRVRR